LDVETDTEWITEQNSQLAIANTEGSATRISCRLLELHPIAINLVFTPVFEEDEAAQVRICLIH
jgi:hypothetical protein